ncbi:HI0074 family nucleotidyltransferase substrate-binding subunit [Mucilaginibacter sp.]|uniref:HI0074 family nucleotidyltransferase substrate-binding subunit n=1 Tax=Mucilaginibacter sp. TaxID=1882438 RepID=UPI0026165692|nr:HI0074 family nucleotidyltransferase substrate-binding subunit [Mucilaginibacter sp.]MDB5029596.1 nucleotidyltransferase [Mucilaginibacter sp.]
MENKDVRWQQRFQSFEKAFLFFKSAVDKENYTPIEIGGLVRSLDSTFELGWKTLEQYLYEQDFNITYPREIIKIGFQLKIIGDSDTWLCILQKCNELSHIYDETIAKQAVRIIKFQYYHAIEHVYCRLKEIQSE